MCSDARRRENNHFRFVSSMVWRTDLLLLILTLLALQQGEKTYHHFRQISNVKPRAVICDSPARSFLKKCGYSTNKHGCQRCTVIGEKIKNRVTFQNNAEPLRKFPVPDLLGKGILPKVFDACNRWLALRSAPKRPICPYLPAPGPCRTWRYYS